MRRGRAHSGTRRVLGLAAIVAASWSLASCDGTEAIAISDVTARLSDAISTVVIVRWSTDVPTVGHVEYGPTPDADMSTPLEREAATSHEVVILGLPAEREWSYRVVSESGEARAESEIATIRTGPLPGGLPVLTADGDGNDRFVVTTLLGGADAAVILDPTGQVVWYHFDSRGLDAYRARLSLDGRSMLYNAASVSGEPAEGSELVRVSLDGGEESSIAIPRLAHDFVELPDGTIGAIVVEQRDGGGVPIRGDQIVEVPPGGDPAVVWSAWDCFDPSVDVGDDLETGWTFANALDYHADEDAYYLGMRNLSGIVKISRETWDCPLVFGGPASTIEIDASSARFLHQHQFDWQTDRVLVFDNDGAAGRVSRVLEYRMDLARGVAEEVWQYVADPTLFSFVLGDVTRLDDGDTFVNWSVAGQLDRVSPQGETRWRLNSEVGYAFGFHTLLADPYGAGP